METAVLPAQDHLAQERYRRQNRVMSGMVYPLRGLPRTTRKVKSPPKEFAASSLHSESASVSSNQDVHTAYSNNGVLSPADMSLGDLRSAPLSSSSPHQFTLGVVKTPRYAVHGPEVPESSIIPSLKAQQPAASLSVAVVNGASVASRPMFRMRSDGGLLQGIKKSAEVEKTWKSYDRFAESTRNLVHRRLVEKKVVEKPVEKSDRRRIFDKKILEKKSVITTKQGDKTSNGQKKVGMITILQRSSSRPVEIAAAQSWKSMEALRKPQVQVKDAEQQVHHPVPVCGWTDGDEQNVEGKPQKSSVCVTRVEYIASHLTGQTTGATPSYSPKRAAVIPGVGSRCRSHLVAEGEGGQISDDAYSSKHSGLSKSGSFREVSREGQSGVSLYFLQGSPPKASCERWAGPGYTNSPPPSTLPFPTFPIQRVKSSLAEVSLAAEVAMQGRHDSNSVVKFSSAPSSPTRAASSFSSGLVMNSAFMDPSSATKDLRRILNLDVEEIFEGGLRQSDVLSDTATQGLKRILQLG